MDRSAIAKALCAKGFQKVERTNHTYLIYYSLVGTKSSVKTLLSRGAKYRSISSDLQNKIAKQCKLRKKDFLRFVECEMTRAEYDQHLRNKNHI